jgi:hypothetical protein
MKTYLSLLFCVLSSIAFASHFTGTYQDSSGIILVIQQGTDGVMKGTVSGSNIQLQLQGQGNEHGAQGVLVGPQGQLAFQAQLSPDDRMLQFTMMPVGPDGKPNQQAAQQLSFQRISNTAQPVSPQPGQPGPVNPNSPQPVPPLPNPMSSPNSPNNPLSQGDKWSGIYTGNAGQITVAIQAANGGYAGYIEASGIRYPFQAQGHEASLLGKFQTPDGIFDFVLRQDQAFMYLSTGGTEYVLEKQLAPTSVDAPVNPLSNP